MGTGKCPYRFLCLGKGRAEALLRGMRLALKSKKSFERIKFEDYELANYHEYFPKKKERDEKARSNYRKILEEDDIEGLFMRDILREEIKADDSRLQ